MTTDEQAEAVARMLSAAEKRVILNMDRRYRTAREIGTAGRTLMEMTDLRREQRGIDPPLQLVLWEVDDHDIGRRFWTLSSLGLRVREILQSEANHGR